MPRLDNKTDLVTFVRRETKEQGSSVWAVCREAGLGVNAVYMMDKHRTVNLDTVMALLTTLGYRLEIVPDTIDEIDGQD